MRQKKSKFLWKVPMYTDYLILGILCVLLVIQIVFSYNFLNKSRMESYYNSSEKLVQKLILDDENIMENLSRLAATVSQDDDVVKLVHGKSLDESEMISLYVRMRKYVAVSQTVKGIVLYSKSQDKMFDVLRPFATPNENIQNQLRNNLNGQYSQRKSFVIFNNDYDGYNNAKFVFVHFFDGKREDAIAIYMDYKNLQLSYSGYQDDIHGHLIVADSNGSVIYGGGNYLPGSSIAEENIFAAKEDYSNCRFINYNGVKSVVFSEYSSYSDRWYISVTPVMNIKSSTILSPQNAFVFIGVIITLFVIIRWLIWFKRIKISIKDLRPQQLHRREEEKLNKISGQLFDYMNRSELSGANNIEDILPPGVNASMPCACLIIKIDRFNEFRENCLPMEIDLYRYGMRNIFEELISSQKIMPYYVNRFEDRMEYLLFNISGAYNFEQRFYETAKSCINKFYDYIGIETSFFISRSDSCKKINMLYAKANEIAKYGFYFGSGIVLDASVVKKDNDVIFNEGKRFCDAIKDSILVGRGEEEEYLKRLIQHMMDMSAQQIHDCLLYLMLNLHSAAETLQKNGIINTGFDIVKSLSQFEQAEYISDVDALIKQMLNDIDSQRTTIKEQKMDLLAEKCIALIKEEYADPNFCLESIAEVVGLSANYLGRKFRQAAGMSIADKITEYRLAEAERQMVSTNKSIKTIMADVGFTNNSYFTVAFRKRYGVAPSVYRRNKRTERM